MSMELSRIRFLDDLDGRFCYLNVQPRPNLIEAKSQQLSEDNSKLNMCRERKIFVKAALQLLDAQERNVVNSLIVPSLIGADDGFDIIRSGYLMKGTRTSKIIPNIGLSGSKSSYTWKSKYIELKHGEFSYYDDSVEEAPLVIASLHGYHSQTLNKPSQQAPGASASATGSSSVAFKKTIPLSPDICSCRVVQYVNGRGGPHQHQIHLLSERDDVGPQSGAVDEGFTPNSNNISSGESAFVPGHAFEICLLGGQRRLFLAGSAEECREWVRDIVTAMVGGRNASSALTPAPPSQSAASDFSDKRLALLLPTAMNRGTQGIGANGRGFRQQQQEGGSGPYAVAIAEFLNLQQRLHAVRDEDGYKALMKELVDRRTCVSIPVAFIKGKCADSSFSGSGGASSHAGNPPSSSSASNNSFSTGVGINLGLHGFLGGKYKQQSAGKLHQLNGGLKGAEGRSGLGEAAAVCVERSQMWKDLQRDEVCVNGECIAGSADSFFTERSDDGCGGGAEGTQGGAEAIIGLLVRHLADAVDRAKADLHAILQRSQTYTPHGCHRLLLQVMTEAQIVQCARSVLMMCNRTQSGGDTYYCVDSLLRRKVHVGNGSDSSYSASPFILAPMSNKAEPLIIEIDLVETTRKSFDPLQSVSSVSGKADRNGPSTPLNRAASASAPPYPFSTPVAATGGDGIASCQGGDGAGKEWLMGEQPSPRADFIDALAADRSSPPLHRMTSVDAGENVGDGAKKRLSRRLQLKLSIDDDLNYYDKERSSSFSLYTDSSTPLVAGKLLRSEFVSILEENSSRTSEATTEDRHPRYQSAGNEGGGQRSVVTSSSGSRGDSSHVDCSAAGEANSSSYTMSAEVSRRNNVMQVASVDIVSHTEGDMYQNESYACSGNSGSNQFHMNGKDDSTVISDITFDTTAAFSQSTTVASYHLQQAAAQGPLLGGTAENELTSPLPPGKTKSHSKSKYLIKMISSRIPSKLGLTPGGNPSQTFSSQDLQAAATVGASSDPSADESAGAAELRPSYSSFNSLQAVTPGRNRGATTPSGDGSRDVGGAGAGGGMLSSLFKSERSRAKTQQAAQDPAEQEAKPGAEGVDNSDHNNNDYKACVCVRLRVRGVSRYRVCSADPQGDPQEDIWAAMEGAFTQTFFVPAAVEGDSPYSMAGDGPADPGNPSSSLPPVAAMVVAGPVPAALSRLAMTDRIVAISAHKWE